MARIPVIRIGDTLIATVQEDISDADTLDLQMNLNTTLETSGARGLLIDVSVLETIDSFLGRLLNDMAVGARLLGAETVLVGVQPGVAMTLVELGLELKGVKTALNTEKGLSLLQRNGNG